MDEPPSDGPVTAVIDRVVDDTAVLLFEENEETVGQTVVPAERLPDAQVGTVLSVLVHDGEVVSADPLPEETAARRAAARDRLDRLSDRLSE